MQPTHCHIVVLISGNGSNLQALIDASVSSNFKISAVISNKSDAFGLQRAERDNIPALVINHKDFSSREEFDLALIKTIDEITPDLIVLAGFMRILGSEFVSHFAGRIINIHPSLLPKYPGINTHQRALEAGDKEHGVTVHFVDETYDTGKIIAQRCIDISDVSSPEEISERVLAVEHELLPYVIEKFALDKIIVGHDRVKVLP